jgi:hypothetical protein
MNDRDRDHYDRHGHHNENPTRRVAGKYYFFATLAALASIIPWKNAKAGWGRCSECNCQQYQGTTNICDNCGHNYAAHW